MFLWLKKIYLYFVKQSLFNCEQNKIYKYLCTNQGFGYIYVPIDEFCVFFLRSLCERGVPTLRYKGTIWALFLNTNALFPYLTTCSWMDITILSNLTFRTWVFNKITEYANSISTCGCSYYLRWGFHWNSWCVLQYYLELLR